LAIVVLFLWIATAVAGFTLLRGGGVAREAARPPLPAAEAPVRIGAAPLAANGLPPPIEFPRVATAPEGDHTLREFSHPALGVTGIGCWMAFTLVHYAPMAWIAFATLVVTLLLGLGWFASSQRSAATSGWNFPKRLVLVHGGLATCSLVLAVVTAVLASRA
jgi:hypothetical protein